MSWIRDTRQIFDWQVMPTFEPTAYTLNTMSLYGHLRGIDLVLGTLTTEEAAVEVHTATRFYFPGGDSLHGDGTNLFYTTADAQTTNQITSN